MTSKIIKITCHSKEDWKSLQEYFFDNGYRWWSIGKKIWFPIRQQIDWSIGVSLMLDSGDKTLTYSTSNNNSITFDEFMIPRKYRNMKVFVNDLFDDF